MNYALLEGKRCSGLYFGHPFTGILQQTRKDWSTDHRHYYVVTDEPVTAGYGGATRSIMLLLPSPNCSIAFEGVAL